MENTLLYMTLAPAALFFVGGLAIAAIYDLTRSLIRRWAR